MVGSTIMSPTDAFIWSLLGYAVYPTWLLTGMVDFVTHQRTHIASTSGVRESLLHVAQMVQNGVPVLVVLFLEINASTLAVLAVLVLVHTLTAYVDINYTSSRRAIGPPEQLAHAVLIGLPILAWVLLLLVGRADAAAMGEWSFQLRATPWDLWVILTVLAGGALFSATPTFAELWQTWRFARREAAATGTR